MSEQLAELKRQAREALEGGMATQALNYTDQAIAIDPNDANLQVFRGIALSKLQMNAEATDAFRRAIVIDTQSSYAYYNLAMHQFQLGELAEAKIMAQEALRYAPEMQAARNLVANIDAKQMQASAPPVMSAPPPQEMQRSAYVRPGYEQSYDPGGVPFVRNMGAAWSYAIWIIAIIDIACNAMVISAVWPTMMESFGQSAAGDRERIQKAMQQAQSGVAAFQILATLSWVAGLLWGVFDIANRKTSWAWIITFVCCFPLLLPVYVLSNRR